MQQIKDTVWAYKYAPKTIDEIIATDALRSFGKRIIEQGEIPNLLLVGPPGIGKTTLAKVLVQSIGATYVVINASMKGNIDTLRNEISQFASTMSFSGGKKYIILDEADHLNQLSTQPALRNFIDTYSSNCGFILTANYGNKIIEPLKDRLQVEEFKFAKTDVPGLIKQSFEAIKHILEAEGIEYDKRSLATFIAKNVPSWRKIIMAVQKTAMTSQYVGENLLTTNGDIGLDSLVEALQKRDYGLCRQWVADNVENDTTGLFTTLEQLVEKAKPQSKPSLIILLAQYQYQAAFVADQEINTAAFLAEIMAEGLL